MSRSTKYYIVSNAQLQNLKWDINFKISQGYIYVGGKVVNKLIKELIPLEEKEIDRTKQGGIMKNKRYGLS
jgi:hypothetical protein